MELSTRPVVLYTFAEQRGVTIHNRVEAVNHLTIPSTCAPLERDVLTPPWKGIRRDSVFWLDMAGNVLFLAPFSFCLVMYLLRIQEMSQWRAALLITLLSAVLSLAIEMGQSFLPTRYSSLHDLLCNVLGATVGAVLLGTAYRYHEAKRLRVPNKSQGF